MIKMMTIIVIIIIKILKIIIITIIKVKLLKQFSDDVGMGSSLEKCAKVSFKEGKMTSTGNIAIADDTEIQ